MVVHGIEGLDEISLCGPTKVAELRDGQVKEYLVEPETLGLTRCRLEDLRGGSPQDSAAVVRSVLQGKKGAARDVVLLNSGAALYVSGSAASINEGMRLAAESIDSGGAARTRGTGADDDRRLTSMADFSPPSLNMSRARWSNGNGRCRHRFCASGRCFSNAHPWIC